MLDLLNASNLNGKIFWLLVVLGILLIVEILVFAILLVRSRRRLDERQLVGISLDTANVRRKFNVGDEFDCSGLVVWANYNIDPTSKDTVDYIVLTEDEFNEAKSQSELNGCYIVKPNMNEAGQHIITVTYQDTVCAYSVEVSEAVEQTVNDTDVEPIVVSTSELVSEEPIVSMPLVYGEESYDVITRRNVSFTARLILSDDKVKQWYTELKNELLSYKKTKARTSWKRETFRVGREVVARIAFRGKTMCLYLPLNAVDFADSKYLVEDVSDVLSNVETPMLYRLKSARRIKYAAELIAMSMEKLGVVRVERTPEDYYVPYETVDALVSKGLIKRKTKLKSK